MSITKQWLLCILVVLATSAVVAQDINVISVNVVTGDDELDVDPDLDGDLMFSATATPSDVATDSPTILGEGATVTVVGESTDMPTLDGTESMTETVSLGTPPATGFPSATDVPTMDMTEMASSAATEASTMDMTEMGSVEAMEGTSVGTAPPVNFDALESDSTPRDEISTAPSITETELGTTGGTEGMALLGGDATSDASIMPGATDMPTSDESTGSMMPSGEGTDMPTSNESTPMMEGTSLPVETSMPTGADSAMVSGVSFTLPGATDMPTDVETTAETIMPSTMEEVSSTAVPTDAETTAETVTPSTMEEVSSAVPVADESSMPMETGMPSDTDATMVPEEEETGVPSSGMPVGTMDPTDEEALGALPEVMPEATAPPTSPEGDEGAGPDEEGADLKALVDASCTPDTPCDACEGGT